MNPRFNLVRRLTLSAAFLLLAAPSGVRAQAPSETPAQPTAHPADVISVFSDVYGWGPVDEFSTGWDNADANFVPVGWDLALEYTVYDNPGFLAMQLGYPGIDANAMTHFHMDVWTAAPPPDHFAVKLVDFGDNLVFSTPPDPFAVWPGDDQEVNLFIDDLAVGQWTSIDIPLDDFVFPGTGLPMTRGAISQILIEAAGMTVYIDNVYFYRPSSPKPSVDIYMLDTKSGEVSQVTSLYDSNEYGAAVSNDGKTIVHDVTTFVPFYTQKLYLTDVETGVSTPLEGGEGGNDARFSPNGKYIAFDRGAVGDATLYLAEVKGKNAGTVSVLRENAVDVTWSNDSKYVAFRDVTDGSIRAMDLDTGSETIVASAGENPSWSPNGKSIAFSLYDGSYPGKAIFAVEVKKDGTPKGSPVQLTQYAPDSYQEHPSWSNNSKTIVYQANPGYGDWNFDLLAVNVKDGTSSVLYGNPYDGEFDPAFSDNGRFVVFSATTDPFVAGKGFARSETIADLDVDVVPEGFTLEQNYPNPFNPTTSIGFELPADANVRLTIFDVMGREVTRLIDRPMSAGSHTVNWSAAADMPSGTYFYRINAGGFVQTRPMTLVK